ncbi:MAG TPA: sulfatase-like hydrolase/transferase [Thermoanaerobaculia bacterium]|nr:sulfatase-like hydrolase/transferase [Thermoanaerobaculia bacterium]
MRRATLLKNASFTLLPIAAVVFAFACRSREREQPPRDTPLFIISIDTLRSDRLPLYGHAEGHTPNLDRFRRDAVLFRKAFSNVPLTLPAHASLFTGSLPHEHGVRDNIGYRVDPDEAMLAHLLRAHGYETGAAVSSFVLRRDTGIAKGFDFYDDAMTINPAETMSSWQRDGDATRLALTSWLESARSEKVFGFLHLYEPHLPYSPPEPWASRLADPYDGEIARADEIVGAFLETLRAKGLYDRAMIVILSDHGEGLGDHGELEHGVFLYRESIQVPLLVKLPENERAGEEIASVASLTDLVPTILGRVGIAAQRELDGVDLFAATAPADRTVYSESYYPRLHYGWSELISQVGERFHLIEAPTVELYDYVDDPAETRNVAGEHRRIVATLRAKIATILAASSFEEPVAMSPEDIRKLESLGYLGVTTKASGPLPDPKQHIALLTQFGRGAAALQKGDYDTALAIGNRIVADNPRFLQGWGLISSAHRKRGDAAGAVRALEKQMEESPGNPQTALALASLQLELKNFREARTYAELAAPHVPSFAYETLASIALAEKDLAAAENAAKKAAEASPLRVQPLMLLSQVHHARRNFQAELELLERVRSMVGQQRLSPIAELEFRRGEALLQLRRAADAERAFRAETEHFPSNRRAWVNLALVVGAQGRRDEARSLLAKALEANPDAAMRRLAREALDVMGDVEGGRRLGV